MLTIRTDLAAEAHALWRENAGETTQLPGVKAREGEVLGFPLTRVEILDRAGEEALGKPRGTYLSLDLGELRGGDDLARAAQAVGEALRPLLPEEGPLLCAGVGNRDMTPDALGPLAVDHLLVTRHLGGVLPGLRPVSALAGGVLGDTGLEAAEWVRGAAQAVVPGAILLIDALAARSLDRLCTTVQLSDTGLAPGSGVGNRRMALDRETLGAPVISIGVPTVVDAETVARDVLGEVGGGADRPAALGSSARRLFVTPDGIDQKVRLLGKVIGYGVSLAAQEGVSYGELVGLME